MRQILAVTEQAFATDTGRHRSANEDSFFVHPPAFVVADGMGGAQAGEVASRTAVESFGSKPTEGQVPEDYLRERIELANKEIHRLAGSDPAMAGMGTTLTGAVVVGESNEVVIGHVGDSRAYRFRDGHLEQLTRDHSLVEEMRRKGQITDEQAETHPQRSIITRALGPEPSVAVDLQTVSAQPGDVYLLCSDGLTTMVDDAHLAAALAVPGSLQDVVDGLIRAANDAGGRDNITVGVFRLGGGQPDSQPDALEAEQPTLIGGSAAAAGLDSEAIRRESGNAGARPTRGAPSRKRKAARRTAKALAALLVGVVIVVGAYFAGREVWFVSTDEGGRVALYQGVPYELPFGIELYSEHYSIPVQTDTLPANRREAVTGHDLRSRGDAASLIEDIDRSTLATTGR